MVHMATPEYRIALTVLYAHSGTRQKHVATPKRRVDFTVLS
jgi:hypothetical protein